MQRRIMAHSSLRGSLLSPRRPQRPKHLPQLFHLGHPRPRSQSKRLQRSQTKARHLRLARRPRQLHDRHRLRLRRTPPTQAEFAEVLARRPPPRRQGNHHASTASTGPRSCIAAKLAAPQRKSPPTAGFSSTTPRCRSPSGNIVRTETILDSLRHPLPTTTPNPHKLESS